MNQPSKSTKIDAETQKILGELIKQGILELKPTINKEGVHYIELEKNLKDADSVHVDILLRDLEEQGVLESEIIDRILRCPDCGSPEVHSKYGCPKCDSYNVEYTELLEHVKCGYIGSKDKFMKGLSLFCPGCQTKLVEGTGEPPVRKHDDRTEVTVQTGVQYFVIGSCYLCEKCGYHFDQPVIIHFCQKCRRTFTYKEAKYVKIFAYKITAETVGKLGRDLPILENIKETLIDEGFEVQLHSQVTGASGVQHSFDILAEKNETRLVIDISLTGSKNDMISLLGKKVDVNPTKALIIDLSNLDELTPLGKVYDIMIFKPTKNDDLQRQLKNFLAALDLIETKKSHEI